MTNDSVVAPVVDDLSAYIIGGAVSAVHKDVEFESDSRTPAQGLDDAVEAERLGFRTVFLSERWDIKEAGVILSGAAARTSHINLATGLIAPLTRHPWQAAAFAATMQACYGNRFILGLGRGEDGVFRDMGMRKATYRELVDYVAMLRTQWRGETVHYQGSIGTFPALKFMDTVPGELPPVWFGTFARSKGAETLASSFDGVILPPVICPEATARSVARIRLACEKIGRDPATIRIAQAVITAPELDELETLSLAHARSLGYLQYKGWGEVLVEENGWEMSLLDKLRSHKQLAENEVVADRIYHRHEMLEPARLIPDELMKQTCAIGSVEECVKTLQKFKDAGADEITTYGSTPGQNAKLVAAWRDRTPQE